MIVSDNNLKFISKYDKKKLVPFGEFLPFESFLNYIGLKKITPGYESFSSGEGNPLLKFNFDEKKIKILPLICYEIIFPGLVEENSKYNFLINISEDAWFGKSIGIATGWGWHTVMQVYDEETNELAYLLEVSEEVAQVIIDNAATALDQITAEDLENK